MILKWMIMKTRIEIAHNGQKVSSFLYDLIRKSFASNVCICFANFNHSLTLFFLNDQEWKDKRTDIIKHEARSVPSVNRPFIGLFASISISLLFSTSKKFVKPIGQAFISACDGQFAMPLSSVSISSLCNFSEIKTAFSIHNSGKIRQLRRSLVFCKLHYSRHITSYVNDLMIINERRIDSHRERLSVLAA